MKRIALALPLMAAPNYFAAYAVEFADGERLCWLHQDEDGELAAFQCA